MFRTDVGRFPTAGEGLKALVEAPAGAEGWVGPYLRKTKGLNDPWGRPLIYAAPAQEGGEATVTSLGADGKPGGAGLNADITSGEGP
jgi:general secretion pathway protein G